MPALRASGPIVFFLSRKILLPLPFSIVIALCIDCATARCPEIDMATLTDDHGTLQPVCQNCQTSTTPLWRRDEIGSVLCNACGLFLKLHGRPRPISLKTDVIKSRNRVKSAGQSHKKRVRQHRLDDPILGLPLMSCHSHFSTPTCPMAFHHKGPMLVLRRQIIKIIAV